MIITKDNIPSCKRLIACSGFFNPIHKGHIEYLELSRELGSHLIVIVNSDKQAIIKKGSTFMNCDERMIIVNALRCVDYVIESVDEDITVCKTLELIKPSIFAKGGDRFSSEIPEAKICRNLGIEMLDGLGNKIQSSSNLIVGSEPK